MCSPSSQAWWRSDRTAGPSDNHDSPGEHSQTTMSPGTCGHESTQINELWVESLVTITVPKQKKTNHTTPLRSDGGECLSEIAAKRVACAVAVSEPHL